MIGDRRTRLIERGKITGKAHADRQVFLRSAVRLSAVPLGASA